MTSGFDINSGLLRRLRHKAMQPWWTRRLRQAGVEVGADVTLFGSPTVSRAPDSRIQIGARVSLISESSYTALGVAHSTTLRTLMPGAILKIGEDTGISGGSICAASRVTIGARCLIGADVMIFDTDFHPVHHPLRRHQGLPAPSKEDEVMIGDDVFIGARSIVVKGSSIGNGSVIAAGSIVTGSIPESSIAAGQPARVIGPVRAAPPDRATT